MKLKNVITRRILKFIEDEMKKDPAMYDAWYKEFNQFIKEGIMSDPENKEQLLRLTRYNSTLLAPSESCSLEDYIKTMQEGQKNIYFLTGTDAKAAFKNPFMEPFKDTDYPVLILQN